MVRPGPRIATTAITLGVLCSAAGNTAWAWSRSPVLVGVGLAMSAVLPVAVRLFRASRGADGWPRVERALIFGFICGGAALYSLVHASALLHDLGLSWVIAWVPAAVTEALVVQAARAAAPLSPRQNSRKTPTPRERTPAGQRPVTRPKAATVTEVAAEGETAEQRTRRLARQRKAAERDRKRQEQAA